MTDWGQTEATTEEAEKTILRVTKMSIPTKSKRVEKMLEPIDEGS